MRANKEPVKEAVVSKLPLKLGANLWRCLGREGEDEVPTTTEARYPLRNPTG
jgi:hypothetical protein